VTGSQALSRLASIAIGHRRHRLCLPLCLPELPNGFECGSEEARTLGHHDGGESGCRDISDLPLVLAVLKGLPWLTGLPCTASENMRRIPSKGTKPEMYVRRFVHGKGYRYRLHVPYLPGKPDLVFPRLQKSNLCSRMLLASAQGMPPRGAFPDSRRDYWGPKLMRNVPRGTATQLPPCASSGGVHSFVWECETKDLERHRKEIDSIPQPVETIGPSTLTSSTACGRSNRARRPARRRLVR